MIGPDVISSQTSLTLALSSSNHHHEQTQLRTLASRLHALFETPAQVYIFLREPHAEFCLQNKLNLHQRDQRELHSYPPATTDGISVHAEQQDISGLVVSLTQAALRTPTTDGASCTGKRDCGRNEKESAMAFVVDPSQHSPGAIAAKPWETALIGIVRPRNSEPKGIRRLSVFCICGLNSVFRLQGLSFLVYALHLRKAFRKYTEIFNSAKLGWPDRRSDPGPPECKASELPLHHLARSPSKVGNDGWKVVPCLNAEEYTACIQVGRKKGFQKCSATCKQRICTKNAQECLTTRASGYCQRRTLTNVYNFERSWVTICCPLRAEYLVTANASGKDAEPRVRITTLRRASRRVRNHVADGNIIIRSFPIQTSNTHTMELLQRTGQNYVVIAIHEATTSDEVEGRFAPGETREDDLRWFSIARRVGKFQGSGVGNRTWISPPREVATLPSLLHSFPQFTKWQVSGNISHATASYTEAHKRSLTRDAEPGTDRTVSRHATKFYMKSSKLCNFSSTAPPKEFITDFRPLCVRNSGYYRSHDVRYNPYYTTDRDAIRNSCEARVDIGRQETRLPSSFQAPSAGLGSGDLAGQSKRGSHTQFSDSQTYKSVLLTDAGIHEQNMFGPLRYLQSSAYCFLHDSVPNKDAAPPPFLVLYGDIIVSSWLLSTLSKALLKFCVQTIPSPHANKAWKITQVDQRTAFVRIRFSVPKSRLLSILSLIVLALLSLGFRDVKAVHDKLSTFEINLRKKLLLPVYISAGALSDMRPVKLYIVPRRIAGHHQSKYYRHQYAGAMYSIVHSRLLATFLKPCQSSTFGIFIRLSQTNLNRVQTITRNVADTALLCGFSRGSPVSSPSSFRCVCTPISAHLIHSSGWPGKTSGPDQRLPPIIHMLLHFRGKNIPGGLLTSSPTNDVYFPFDDTQLCINFFVSQLHNFIQPNGNDNVLRRRACSYHKPTRAGVAKASTKGQAPYVAHIYNLFCFGVVIAVNCNVRRFSRVNFTGDPAANREEFVIECGLSDDSITAAPRCYMTVTWQCLFTSGGRIRNEPASRYLAGLPGSCFQWEMDYRRLVDNEVVRSGASCAVKHETGKEAATTLRKRPSIWSDFGKKHRKPSQVRPESVSSVFPLRHIARFICDGSLEDNACYRTFSLPSAERFSKAEDVLCLPSESCSRLTHRLKTSDEWSKGTWRRLRHRTTQLPRSWRGHSGTTRSSLVRSEHTRVASNIHQLTARHRRACPQCTTRFPVLAAYKRCGVLNSKNCAWSVTLITNGVLRRVAIAMRMPVFAVDRSCFCITPAEIYLLTYPQCDNRAEHLPRRRHRGANPRPSNYRRVRFPGLGGGVVLGFSHVGIKPDDTAGRRGSSGDLPFPLPLHSGASPYSLPFTRIGSQRLDVSGTVFKNFVIIPASLIIAICVYYSWNVYLRSSLTRIHEGDDDGSSMHSEHGATVLARLPHHSNRPGSLNESTGTNRRVLGHVTQVRSSHALTDCKNNMYWCTVENVPRFTTQVQRCIFQYIWLVIVNESPIVGFTDKPPILGKCILNGSCAACVVGDIRLDSDEFGNLRLDSGCARMPMTRVCRTYPKVLGSYAH
ncbi:hypothetical protein PR048_029242 [Dryococelus australis]|uniref:Uncharacterized protein n=1 Tax=Dryococelus australis TaxID=614101 RepID=A0ABQ9GCT4_9NEOP|nr:hypothetical protein PR048_029242 [Dryococelus australis]